MKKNPESPRLGGELRSRQAAAQLKEEMRTGCYANAAQLPPELELADHLGVSRTVIRDVLSDLERDGYLERVRGIGTVVNRGAVKLRNRMDHKVEFFKMVEATGHTPHCDNVMVTKEIADEELCRALELPTDVPQTVLVVRKRVLADDKPVIYCTDVLLLSLFGNQRLEDIDFSRPIFDILSEYCDVEVTKSITHLRAVAGAPAMRRPLALGQEEALLEFNEVCYSRLCKPVMCCQTYYTDFYDFTIVRTLVGSGR